MRILIIGGTGLISTPITRMLLERGDDVTLFNRGQTPPRVPRVVDTSASPHARLRSVADGLDSCRQGR